MSDTIKVHHLKCESEIFTQKLIRNKPWEYRFNDREFEDGDMIIERDWNAKDGYSGDEVWETVTLIVKGGQFGIPKGYVIMTTEMHGNCRNSELSERNPQSY